MAAILVSALTDFMIITKNSLMVEGGVRRVLVCVIRRRMRIPAENNAYEMSRDFNDASLRNIYMAPHILDIAS